MINNEANNSKDDEYKIIKCVANDKYCSKLRSSKIIFTIVRGDILLNIWIFFKNSLKFETYIKNRVGAKLFLKIGDLRWSRIRGTRLHAIDLTYSIFSLFLYLYYTQLHIFYFIIIYICGSHTFPFFSLFIYTYSHII